MCNLQSVKSLQRARTKLGLKGTRQQKASFETIASFIEEIRQRFPMMGARQMVTTMRQDYTLKVPEYVTMSSLWILLITVTFY
jgi:hypothetical protein